MHRLFALVIGQLNESETERRRLEDVNMQLLLKLENITMTTAPAHVASSNETSLFAELEMLSQSLCVDSFSNQPAQPITIATQVSKHITAHISCNGGTLMKRLPINCG